MIGATICSGIGAPEAAAPGIEWRLACEIERFPRAVLAHRHGYACARKGGSDHALWPDFTALRVRHMRRFGIPFPNIIVAGTPCQAFSVAGNRQSLSDARGNLTLAFVRFVHACRRAERHVLRWLVWENVPGVLSTADNAFGCFLGGLVGADGPVFPDDGPRCECGAKYRDGRNIKWPGQGMVAGPLARAAWRVLDAQYFGVAQRRQRVFVVAGFGDDTDPASVLFERLGLYGNPAPSRETRKDIAPTIASRPTGGGGLGTDFDCDGGLIASTGDVSHCLNGGGMGRQDYETETLVSVANGGSFDDDLSHPLLAKSNSSHDDSKETYIAHSLRADGFDASEDGTGRGTPLVAAYRTSGNCGAWDTGDRVDALTTSTDPNSHIIAFDTTQITSDGNYSVPKEGEPCHPLAAGAHPPGGTAETSDLPSALRASQGGGDKPHVLTSAVRRLTTRECCRLQGFDDDYLLIPGYGGMSFDNDSDRAEMARYLGFESIEAMMAFRPPADGPQYKALGNAMNRKVMAWILGRVEHADQELKKEKRDAEAL